jgi:hypothetical protein
MYLELRNPGVGSALSQSWHWAIDNRVYLKEIMWRGQLVISLLWTEEVSFSIY